LLHEKVHQTLEGVLERFKSGDLPETIALAVYPTFNIPCSNWSLLNRFVTILSGTEDARGFRQWKEVGRYVKKGAKAFCILAPKMKKSKKENEEGQEEERYYLAGFLGVAVFRVEDTEGDPLDYEQLELPSLPLLEVAEAWGINTRPVSGGFGFYGRFSPDWNSICLASPEESIFFHELSHAAHHKVKPLVGGQHWNQEIVAELSAAVLCQLVGKKQENPAQHYRYIERYARTAGRDPIKACLEVFSETEKVLNLILAPAKPQPVSV